MYIALVASMFLVGLFETPNKQAGVSKYIKAFVIWLIITVIFGFNNWSVDYENYLEHYENVELGDAKRTLEPGFVWLMNLSQAQGFSFETFLVIIAIFTAALQAYIISSISSLPILLFACYILCPLYPNIVQIRSYVSFSIALTGIFLCFQKRAGGRLVVMTAAAFHIGSIAMMPLLFPQTQKLLNNLRTYAVTLLGLILISITLPFEEIYQTAAELNPKFTVLSEINYSKINTLIYYSPILILNWAVILHYHFSKTKTLLIHDSEQESLKTNHLITLIKYGNLTIPLLFVSRDFSRIIINFTPFAYAYLGVIANKQYVSKNHNQFLLSRLAMASVAIGLFYTLNLHMNGGEYFATIQQTFESNWLLGKISGAM